MSGEDRGFKIVDRHGHQQFGTGGKFGSGENLGAEGLADKDGQICALADDPETFASHVVRLLREPAEAERLARAARAEVETTRDMRAITRRLAESYRDQVFQMRSRANTRTMAAKPNY